MKLPRYGLAVEYDLNGKALKSWHDATGKNIRFVTCLTEYKGNLYIGSFIDDYIGIVKY